jgi:hypothetical protein
VLILGIPGIKEGTEEAVLLLAWSDIQNECDVFCKAALLSLCGRRHGLQVFWLVRQFAEPNTYVLSLLQQISRPSCSKVHDMICWSAVMSFYIDGTERKMNSNQEISRPQGLGRYRCGPPIPLPTEHQTRPLELLPTMCRKQQCATLLVSSRAVHDV